MNTSAPATAASVHLAEHPARLGRLARILRERRLDAAVLWDPGTVCYFTGNEISGPNVAIVDADGACTVVCDEYDAFNFSGLGAGVQLRPCPYGENPVEHLAAHVRRHHCGARIGLEFADLRLALHQALVAAIGAGELVPIDRDVGDIRLVKSAPEVECIRAAAAAVEAAYAAATEVLVSDTTEHRVAAAIYAALLAHGSHYTAGQPYVKSGPRALNTHARWGDRAVAPGEHVLLELAACRHRYHAALMRTRLPTRIGPALQRALDAVRAGRDAHLEALRPGITAGALHQAYLRALDRYGVRGWNRHSSGYSLGIAFPPYWGEIRHLTLGPGADRPLQPGMVLHVIAGLTEPEEGVGHVGLSECVLVTETGFERLINMRDFL